MNNTTDEALRAQYLIDGHEVVFDLNMKPILDRYTWHIKQSRPGLYYVHTAIRLAGKQRTLSMHRLLTGIRGKVVDHINGNGLDNRLENLRLCSVSQNNKGATKRKGASKYRGVRRHNKNKKWSAAIIVDKKQIWLGSFNNEIDAAKAYDKASREYHGEFGRTNFPSEG